MGILITTSSTPPPGPTQKDVDDVMALQKKHCAPSTWDKFVKSLPANGFPFRVTK